MTAKGLEGLLESIKSDAQKAHDQKMEAVHKKGELKYKSMMDEACLQIEKQKKQNEWELKQIYAKEVRQAEKKSQRDLVSIKQEYVQRLLESSLKSLETMDDKNFLTLLMNVLKRENGGQRPRIHVDSNHYDLILDAVGSEYQVIDDASISSGFVLSFNEYDIDYEFKNIFAYRKESFMKTVLIRLFEANHES